MDKGYRRIVFIVGFISGIMFFCLVGTVLIRTGVLN